MYEGYYTGVWGILHRMYEGYYTECMRDITQDVWGIIYSKCKRDNTQDLWEIINSKCMRDLIKQPLLSNKLTNIRHLKNGKSFVLL